jgi:uncharacterized protein YbaR (Trm112 family)
MIANMSEIEADVLALMRCPVTQTTLHHGSDALLQALNQAIDSKTLTNRIGQTVSQAMDGVLVNATGEVALAIRAGIIQLIADESVQIPDSLKEIAK